MRYFLFAPFDSVTVSAKHLAILDYGGAALLPRRDVVSLHLFQFEMLAAVGANTLLALIGFTLCLLVECPETQVSQIPAQHISVDTRFFHDFVVLHQIVNLLFECGGIVDIFPELFEHGPQSSPFISLRYFGKVERTHVMICM